MREELGVDLLLSFGDILAMGKEPRGRPGDSELCLFIASPGSASNSLEGASVVCEVKDRCHCNKVPNKWQKKKDGG